MILVSHDHDFIQKVANVIIELTAEGLCYYEGDYESYLYHKNMIKKESLPDATKHNTIEQKEIKISSMAQKDRQQVLKSIRMIENKIEKLIEKRRKASEKLALYEYGNLHYQECIRELDLIKEELECVEAEWDRLTTKLE
jgi:ATPase subunit of ABC transporter with duplicated ATPase domains